MGLALSYFFVKTSGMLQAGKKKKSWRQIFIWTWTLTRHLKKSSVANCGCIFMIWKKKKEIQGCKPKLFTQSCTVNPPFLQHIIHVWHIRGNVHTGILSSLHCYYVFISFSMSHNLNLAVFNSYKHSFVCTLLIQPCLTQQHQPQLLRQQTITSHLIFSWSLTWVMNEEVCG